MFDNIILIKAWQDNDLLEALITCSSNFVTVNSSIYVTQSSLNNLSELIGLFLDETDKTIFWESGIRGNQTAPIVSFKISMKDNLGHVQIEVFVEIEDGGDLSEHNCCFFINTEIGLLHEFGKKLKFFSEYRINQSLSLNKSGVSDY